MLVYLNERVCVSDSNGVKFDIDLIVFWPQAIESLQGIHIRKVAAGCQASLTLTSSGQVSAIVFDVFTLITTLFPLDLAKILSCYSYYLLIPNMTCAHYQCYFGH